MRLFPVRILIPILFVVIPFAASITVALLNWYPDYARYVYYTEIGRIQGQLLPGTLYTAVSISGIYLVCVVALVFAVYPISDSLIKKRGIENMLVEHRYIKNILYVEIALLIIVTVLFLAPYPLGDVNLLLYNSSLWLKIDVLTLLNGLMITLGFSVTAGIIYIILLAVRKELRFYFAKVLLEIASNEKDETKKTNYLISGIEFYDKYLRRSLNLQIKDIKEIYSRLIIDSNINKNEAMRLLRGAFQSDNDKLKPVRSLAEIANIQETNKFLIQTSIRQRIKDSAILFATLIPAAIAIIQLLLQR